MRGTKAKRLRRAATAAVTAGHIRETTNRAFGGGVSVYHSGYRRIYRDLKHAAQRRVA